MKNAFKILVLALFVMISNVSYAQTRTDKQLIFKMWLFLDHKNTDIRDNKEYLTKGSSLFDLFEKGVDLKFDTLKTNGFDPEYVFLSVDVHNSNAITYKVKKEMEYINIPADNCNGYTLCVDNMTGQSYRIQGFNGCDLLTLLHDIQTQYLLKTNKKLSDKQFLNKYTVSGLDLNCLYNGLKSGPGNWDKYPCLRACQDIQVLVH